MFGQRRAPATLRDVFLRGARGGFAISPEYSRQPFGYGAEGRWYICPDVPVVELAAVERDAMFQVVLWRDFDMRGPLQSFRFFRGDRAQQHLLALGADMWQVEPLFGWYPLSRRVSVEEAFPKGVRSAA